MEINKLIEIVKDKITREIVLQEINIEGYAPLADALGYIFERIPLYISP